MAGVCAKAAGCGLWERSGALSLKGDYNPSFQTVLCDLEWEKGSTFLALEALCADTLLRACPLPAPNASHVGLDHACKRLTTFNECLLRFSHCAKPFA